MAPRYSLRNALAGRRPAPWELNPQATIREWTLPEHGPHKNPGDLEIFQYGRRGYQNEV